MDADRIRKTYLTFFNERGHAVIPSASLIPENDPTVLFTTAGMHPLVPFLLGEPHPEGKRLTNSQKCIRTGDIEEVGDLSHLTFFEMLGNWSLGDYFKEEMIPWSYELLTGAQGFGFDVERLFVTVFEGDDDAPRDDTSIALWQEQFKKAGIDAKVGERIFVYPKSENWWGPAGQTGPCGPDSEMFYDLIGDGNPKAHAEGWTEEGSCHPNCDCGRFVEIGNDVFMEYFKTAEGTYTSLAQKNVDTGMGFERMVMLKEGVRSVFDTSLFTSILEEISSLSGKDYADSDETARAMRIIADHIRTAVFMLGDPRGVAPSNVDQGYILRRIIRRAVRMGKQLGIDGTFTVRIAERVIGDYREAYPELEKNRQRIIDELTGEEEKFSTTLERGLKEVKKVEERFADADEIPAQEAFTLYESYGFPKELTEEVT
ncbi:alanine--tRNA ligase, partial [Patescibacteria group bacterium]